MKKLVAVPENCTGCHVCEMACAEKHFGERDRSLARLRIDDGDVRGEFIPQTCYHCQDPWCMNACPSEIIERDEATGAVLINHDWCTGCYTCVDSCPFGMIKIAPDQSTYKCDLCQGEPVCVERCKFDALRFEEMTPEYRDEATRKAGQPGGRV